MQRRTFRTWFSIAPVALSFALATVFAGSVAEGATLRVAGNGTDSSACGQGQQPCRSIGRAIANAASGDEIVIGPGRYGDLNDNGIFGETGEEAAEAGFGCFCMIRIDKALTLRSRDGAFTAILDAAGAAMAVIRVLADDVLIGGSGTGLTLTGSGSGISGLVVVNASGVTISDLVLTGNGLDGIDIFGGTGNALRRNLAMGNGQAGFAVLGGSSHVLHENVSNLNSVGYWFNGGSGHELRGNLAIANHLQGLLLGDAGVVVDGNAVIGNHRTGIHVLGSVPVVRHNNIYANHDSTAGSINNCGLTNHSGGTLDATENFWGAAAGPGPNPADAVCNSAGSVTISDPVAPAEFRVRVRLRP